MRLYRIHEENSVWANYGGLDGRGGEEAGRLLGQMYGAGGEELLECLNELGPMLVSGGAVCGLTVLSFPFLVDMAEQKELKDQVVLLDFIGALKTLINGFDVHGLGEDLWRAYYESARQLAEYCRRFLNPADLSRLAGDDKGMFAEIYLMAMSFSRDCLPFLINRPFQAAFHIQCPHCGWDLYSLHVTPDGDGHVSNISPADPPAEWDGVDYDDIYVWFTSYLKEIGEHRYAGLLPRLYGSYTCTKCGEKASVMDYAYAYASAHVQRVHVPGKEEISGCLRISEEAMREGDYERALFYCRLALSRQRRLTGERHREISGIYMRMAASYAVLEQYEQERLCAGKAAKLLEGAEGFRRELAQAYKCLGEAWCADDEQEENNDYEASVDYYGRALGIFDQELGENNPESRGVKKSLALLYAEDLHDYGRGLSMLTELLSSAGEGSDGEEETAECSRMISGIYADEAGDYQEALRYYQTYLDYVCKRFGEDSDTAADGYREMAGLYEKSGSPLRAAEYFEQALEINLGEMGRIYTLPDIFRNAAIQVLKVMDKEPDPELLRQRSESAAQSYDDIGALYQSRGHLKKALKCYKKALALREWAIKEPIPSVAGSWLHIAEIREAEGDEQGALEACANALEVYNRVIMADSQDDRPLFQNEARECREEAVKLCRRLWAMDPRTDRYYWNFEREFGQAISYPVVAFDFVREETEPLQSRMGGVPWLADGFQIPAVMGTDGQSEPLGFCMQINFAQLPEMKGLPDSGLLQVYLDRHILREFGEASDRLSRLSGDQDRVRLIYHEAEKLHGGRLPDPESESILSASCSLGGYTDHGRLDSRDPRFEPVLKETFQTFMGDKKAVLPEELQHRMMDEYEARYTAPVWMKPAANFLNITFSRQREDGGEKSEIWVLSFLIDPKKLAAGDFSGTNWEILAI